MFETPDLMTFLHDNYLAELAERRQEAGKTANNKEFKPSLDGFVDWARNYLAAENQPMNVAYLATGLGLRMQHGQVLAMRPQEGVEAARTMYDEGIHITRPSSIPGQGMLRTPTVPITGDR